LNSAIAQQFRDRALFGNFLPEIEKLILVLCCVIEVWIVDKRRKIVFLTSQPEALEVNDPCFPLMENKILRLKVPVNEVAVGSSQIFAEPRQFFVLSQSGAIEAKVPFDEVIDEVVLFPRIGLGAEWRRELEVPGQTDVEEAIQLF
tara:strand:- start:18 stop:455 length:438 start_codon:yes stop_codon:yes gene_type:complete